MHLDDFDFDLPEALIAQRPVEPRDAARLLHVGQTLADRRVRDLPNLLAPGDLLVVNDTRVLPARLSGKRGAVAVSITLVEPDVEESAWWALAKPGRRLKPGDRIVFAGDLTAEVREKAEDGRLRLDFGLDRAALAQRLEGQGEMPLPPYIRRPAGGAARDRHDYQTLFAARPGAVAAPTAGLHFTPALLAALEARGVALAKVTLHVGLGSFQPIKTADPRRHRLHAEYGEIGPEAVAAVEAARRRGGRVVAVGTTALRLLESAADAGGGLRPFAGKTDLYILPGYRFRVVERLLTNFHLPRSSLFMLVSAFAGRDRMLAAYRYAVDQRYRFFSYGDATFLERAAELAPETGG